MRVRVFSTAPQSADVPVGEYLDRCAHVARWSEAAGCTGILIYTDNRLIDPWLVAQQVIQHTAHLWPLVAVQPIYMHPYAVAKMVASLGYLYGRRVALNMVAGGFRNDLLALGDDTPHDRRYDRLIEYTRLIVELVRHNKPITLEGEFYQVSGVQLRPALPADLAPVVFVSGSSPAGMAAAKQLGAVAVEYPKPGGEYEAEGLGQRTGAGIRIGIITQTTREQAWEIAHRRFPGDRRGQMLHDLAMKVSDSHWHKQLGQLPGQERETEGVYWLWPFKNYNTFCPYLVGAFDEVAAELARYMRAGFDHYILDIPASADDLAQIGEVFRRAEALTAV
jgi:alkanesulfonate monooxygenase